MNRQATIGVDVTRKLYSRKGTLLGTVTYPAHWDRTIQKHGGMSFHLTPELRFWALDDAHAPEVRTGFIAQHHRDRAGVELGGVTLEEFEKSPGCSFSPSAAYLRSLMEG
jgi:hypothetical protein